MAIKSKEIFVIFLGFLIYSLSIDPAVSKGLVNRGDIGNYNRNGVPDSIWDQKSTMPLWGRLLLVGGGIAILAIFVYCYCKCRNGDPTEDTETAICCYQMCR